MASPKAKRACNYIPLSASGKVARLVQSSSLTRPMQSPLWIRVAQNEMPPDQPLPDEDKQVLQKWIATGATGLPTSQQQADEYSAGRTLGLYKTATD